MAALCELGAVSKTQTILTSAFQAGNKNPKKALGGDFIKCPPTARMRHMSACTVYSYFETVHNMHGAKRRRAKVMPRTNE